MVRIAIAGASGQVAHEIIDVLLATHKHELILLSRKPVPNDPKTPNATHIQTDYTSVEHLTTILRGTHTLLSFITTQTDHNNTTQKNLIDAAIASGVKRFAPSEWATAHFEHMPWYAGRAEIRTYLQSVNSPTKVLEYSLFQPGLFTNYLAHPHVTAAHMRSFETQFDFLNRRAIIRAGGEDDRITLTTVQDLANVVAEAVEYEGEWPVIGGIAGSELSMAEVIRLGERIRGGAFDVQRLAAEDLSAGVVKSSWLPTVSHPAIPAEEAEALAGTLLASMVLGISAGALRVSDEWNRLLPEYRFTSAEEFLAAVWKKQED